MPGFDNNTMWAENVDFRNVVDVQPQVLADGQLLIGSAVAPNIRISTLTAGAGIAITNGPGSVVITSTTGGFAWNVITSLTNPNSLVKQNGYIPKGGIQVILALPLTATIGDNFQIAGYGNLWTLRQNAGQSISFGNLTTTIGVGGSITATHIRDTIEIVCVTTNTEFQVVDSVGNLTIV